MIACSIRARPLLGLFAAMLLAAAALLLAPAAGAYRGDGVFPVAGNRAGGDVAMLVDGSIVTSDGSRIAPDGSRSRIAGFRGTGVAATADGGALAIQGGDRSDVAPPSLDPGHRIVRWTPGAGVSVVAGTGERGFGGDGGPATAALLDLEAGPLMAGGYPGGLVTRPDGGFVFTDTGNRRIRAVDSAGIIRTVAGGSAARYPYGLAATPDGGYLVLESLRTGSGDDEVDSARVRRIRPDGTAATVAAGRLDPADVAASPDGTAVIADETGDLWLLKPGASRAHRYLAPKRPAGIFDFAARKIWASSVAFDASGGLLLGSGRVMTYVPRAVAPWTLVALRDTRTSRHGVAAVIETTRPGTATLEIARGDRIVARATRPVAAGHSRLRAVAPIRPGWYDVRVRLDGADGATATDEVPIHGAPRLTIPLTRRILGPFQGWADDAWTRYVLGHACRHFGPRRVDCAIFSTTERADVGVASITLGRTGVVLRRNYEWGRHGFRRHPRFIEVKPTFDLVMRLSREGRGRWATGP